MGPRAERRTPQKETAPGRSFEQTKPGTPGASGRGNPAITKWQGARVPGLLQVYTPHRAQPRPARTTKDPLLFPTVSAEPILPLRNPNLVMDENSALPPHLFQPSRAEPLSWLSHQDTALPRIPPSWGISAPCWPQSEDETVLHTHARARRPSAPSRSRSRSRAAPGVVCGAGGEARNAEPGGLWGSGQRGAAGRASDCVPRAGQCSGDRDTRQNKTQAPQSSQSVLAAAPRPASWRRAAPEVERTGASQPYLFGASTGRRPGLGAGWYSVDPI